MPGGNKTGPLGMGPMTGRGLGSCAGNPAAGYGVPYGGGRGRGCRRMYRMTGQPGWGRFAADPQDAGFPAQDQKAVLRSQEILLQNQLEQVKKRLDEIDDPQ